MADTESATAATRSPERATAAGPDIGYEHTFDELVQHVAAELPHFDRELALSFPLRPLPMRRSGVYSRQVQVPPPHPFPPVGPPIPIPVVPPIPPEPGGPAGPGAIETTPAAGIAPAVDGAEAAVADEDSALSLIREELRVDVDGLFPTMTVSGTIFRLFGGSLTWIARVTPEPGGTYAGPISYRDGTSALEPHTDIRVQLTGFWVTGAMKAHVTFSGGGQRGVTRTYDYDRAHFREVGVEFDCASDAGSPVTTYNLGAHPNRPADLPTSTLSIEDVYTRQGIKMTSTGGGDTIPIAEAGTNLQWSDIEMHDAMQRHWSKWADVAQWQLWTLFAGQHELGSSLGGIMFDDMGVAQRQGCAVFYNSFISDPPPTGDPNPAAFVQRMRFWTAVHEIGHTFNLAHAWQKSMGTPWIPLADEPESRSFMNYPYRVSGSTTAFFSNFYYRFSDAELLFLRHAPERFVEQGNAAWFDHHAFEQARRASSTALELTLRVNRDEARFQALEPVIGELKLKNTSNVPVVVDKYCLYSEDVTIIVAPDRAMARRWLPYSRYCYRAEPHVLQPGESLYASCFLSAGRDGWDLAEPGRYRIYAALRTPAGHVLSAPMQVRLDPPASREEEMLAPDVYTDKVGRVLAFGGSRVLDRANDILRETIERLPDRRIAMHAAAALGAVTAVPGRVLAYADGQEPRFDLSDPAPQTAAPLLERAYGDLNTSAETFGHIRVTERVEQVAGAMADTDARAGAADLTSRLATTLEQRNVLPSVVERVREEASRLSR